MLADPQSITLQGVVTSLPKTSPSPANGSRYTYSADGVDVELLVTRTAGRRNRAEVRLNHKKWSADPAMDGAFLPVSMSAVFYVDFPTTGYVNADVATISGDLVNYLDVAGLLTKVINGET